MKRNLPPLNSLRAFEAAARHCSFRLAAEELNVSHSAISHQVKLLESQLNVELFHRAVGSVSLTECGEEYYPALRDAFDRMSDATDRVRTELTSNVLTIQTYITAAGWLIPRLSDFKRKHPDIQVHLNTSSEDTTFESGAVDISILMGYQTQQDVHYDYLFTSEIFPVCSPQFLEEHKSLKKPQDLSPHQLLSIKNAEQDWPNWCQAAGIDEIDTGKGLRFDSYTLALDAAIDSAGVALALRPFRMKDLRDKRLVELFDVKAQAYGDWYIAFRENRKRSKKVSDFRHWLLKQIEDDQDMPASRKDIKKQN